EDVAQDAAHASRRALKWLDEARMVVRLDLERDGVPLADIDDACVFTGALQHHLAARRELLQMQTGALVRAMLAPHHAENPELGVVGLAAENRDDLLVLGVRKLMLCDQLGRVRGRAHSAMAPISERKITRPSLDPISGSVARSGCGIRPSTLRSRLSTPAMLSSDPLGLSTYRN